MTHFNQDSVRIERTGLSNATHNVVHLAISLDNVVSVFAAKNIQSYLERTLETTVGGLFDPHAQRVHFFCFVICPIGCDAKRKVSGLLGLQAERSLTIQ